MRYIDLDRIRMPPGWLARSQAATLAIAAGADPNDHADIWRELKVEMNRISENKCWYCESPIDRSDNAVDHFRPKKRVLDARNPHIGYRWLAFDKDNFRLACTYCNSRRIDLEFGTAGGKADRFPLMDEDKRVYTVGPIDDEEPELLDPCKIFDCELLGCQQENGKPCPTSTDPIQIRRAETSIEVYHLDRDATCLLRHGIAVRLISDIIDGQRLFEACLRDSSRKPEFLKVSGKIRRAISSEASYSGEMKYLLRCQRSSEHPWIQGLLEA
ncbi:hypothetical protein [Dyadobacter sp. 32]|uniref:hypothetical protein n=1 Tax=Dyadobacter sp. 32 TaxID=538966 RepID=UPI0011EF08DB